MRYFYRDQVAASWMMKQFKMRFTDKSGNCIHPVFDSYSVKWYFDKTPKDAASAAYFGEIYYVHPDSLCLCNPRAGDLIDSCEGYDEDIGIWTNARWTPPVGAKIIQRNGTAFMPPEVDHG